MTAKQKRAFYAKFSTPTLERRLNAAESEGPNPDEIEETIRLDAIRIITSILRGRS